jgi:hypothetical protein
MGFHGIGSLEILPDRPALSAVEGALARVTFAV